MDKYFICLANSYKHGGRCIAGIEIAFNSEGKLVIVRHPDGRPCWIRPVSNEPDGAIPNEIAQDIKLFSVIKLKDAIPIDTKPHVEDTKYSQMECRHGHFVQNEELLKLCLDRKHQNIFYFQGKAIRAEMVGRLDYSLMFIHPDNPQVYIDENREKSKYRMKFTYYGSSYDFPITDPVFLEEFKKNPDRYSQLPDLYLTLSLGLEFEGFHYKLVAAVILPPNLEVDDAESLIPDKEISYKDQQKQIHPNAYTKWSQEEDGLLKAMLKQGASINELMAQFKRNEGAIRSRVKKLYLDEKSNHWFDEYEQELTHLFDLKQDIDDRIATLRKKLLEQMEIHREEKIKSKRFTISYSPPRIAMQFDSELLKEENEDLYRSYCTLFDSKTFREENQELYKNYCKPIQKAASIVVRRNSINE